MHRSSGLEEDDGRRKTLAEKTWARRAVVAHGVSACGAANFEEVPGREQYGVGDDATAQWADDMLAYHEENFLNDKGIEVRKGFIIIIPRAQIIRLESTSKAAFFRCTSLHHIPRCKLSASPRGNGKYDSWSWGGEPHRPAANQPDLGGRMVRRRTEDAV